MNGNELVPVYSPADFLEADAIRQHLTSEGIFCHIDGENQFSLRGAAPFVPAWRRMRIMVRSEDAEKVREVIRDNQWPRYT